MLTQLHNTVRTTLTEVSQGLRVTLNLAQAPAFLPVRAFVVLGIVGALAGHAAAQRSMSDGPPGGHYHVERPFNVEHGHVQHHSSTAAEGFARGLSAYVQALGVSKVHHAQANILNEQAEWAAYEHNKKRVDTFYERRAIRQNYLADQRELAAHRDAVRKELLEHKRATDYRRAYKLSLQEFNPANGQIAWPMALRADCFAPCRTRIDQLFAHRSQYKLELDPFVVREIEEAQDELKQCLREHRHLLPTDEYLAAQTFLRGLLYEAKYPPSVG